MTLTDWLAIYGAIGATLGGAWAFYQWWRSGPRLNLSVSANMVDAVFDRPNDDRRFIYIKVQNRGDTPTKIAGLGYVGFDTIIRRWLRKSNWAAVISERNIKLPAVIEVGGEWTCITQQTAELEGRSRRMLLYVWVEHAFSNRIVLKSLVIRDPD